MRYYLDVLLEPSLKVKGLLPQSTNSNSVKHILNGVTKRLFIIENVPKDYQYDKN